MTPGELTCRVTSIFGWRNHPITGAKQHHDGIDMVCCPDKLQAIWDAVKAEVLYGWNGGRGNLVRLYYTLSLRVIYQHLAEIYITNSTKVKQGDLIGRQGTTGDSTGVHLHIEAQVLVNGRWVAVEPSKYVEVPNVLGTHKGNRNLDTSIDPALAPPDVNVDGIKVGDVVSFTGSRHYTGSSSGKAYTARPGPAKVTKIEKGAARPFHLVAAAGGSSTVHGWVAALDITGRDATPNPDTKFYSMSIARMTAGDKDELENRARALGLEPKVEEVKK